MNKELDYIPNEKFLYLKSINERFDFGSWTAYQRDHFSLMGYVYFLRFTKERKLGRS